MTDLHEKVTVSKTALMTALGEHFPKYLNNMKFWFTQKWSKEEFDTESRKLLTYDKMHLHNAFLLAILNKIDSFAPAYSGNPSTSYTSTNTKNNRKRKREFRFSSGRTTFEPYDLYDYLLVENCDTIRPPNSTNPNPVSIPVQRFCVQELFLPDAGFLMGRLLVGAWENGLVSVDDPVAEYLSVAVQVLLKNVLSSIILKRNHYRVTSEGSYFYDVGCPIKDPSLRNTLTKQKIDDGPMELDKEITTVNPRKTTDDSIFLSACEELYPPRKTLITINDVYKAMQDKNILLSHTIYSVNMERMTQSLHE